MKFHEKYPHIYLEFKNLIDQRKSSKEFIADLDNVYKAIDDKDGDTFTKNWSKLFNNKIVHKHPFFNLLLFDLPLPFRCS